jgi:hypothetical protein
MTRICFFLAVFSCASLSLNAASLEDLTYTTTDGEVIITALKKAAAGDLVIPDTIEGNPVTGIGNYAFARCSSLTSITIPNSVTNIENDAFYGCTSLTSITIPDSVTSIGSYAFIGCISLTSITIPDSVIGNGAFYGCTSLTSVTIPDGVTSIGNYAFTCCSSLMSVTIPISVTSIGDYAFYNCTSLTSITIPDSVTSIGNFAFSHCDSLTKITIPNSITRIGVRAFLNCTSLTSITIPDSVTSIDQEAFRFCTRLTSITIPNSITSIASAAFANCISLKSITIGNSVTSIGVYAFGHCISLTSIKFEGAAPTVGADAFAGLPNGAVTVVNSENLVSYQWNGFTATTDDPYGKLSKLEAQLATVTAERDARPTQEAYDAAVVTARTAGQGDVTSDPTSYGLVTQTSYDIVVAKHGAAIAERDARPTRTAYDTAVAESRTAGRSDVTSTPASYNLTTTESYNTVVAERDARFVDTDADGITDVKEAELETDSAEETVFYLQGAYDSAVAASRVAGRGDITADPPTFALTTLAAYNGMVAQKDLTITTLNTTVGEKNALIVQKDNQYNELEEQRVTEAQQLNGIIETRNNTISSNTTTIGSLNETIAQKNTAYATVVAERDARPTQVSYNTVVAERDARPTQEQCDTNATEARLAGRNEVTTSPAAYQLISISTYNTAIAERDARPTAEQLAAVVAERDARPTQTSYNTVVAERNARPTEEAYNALIAERDARPTIEEVKDARLGSVVLQPDVANQSVKIRFSIEETDDFRTWTKRDEINEVTVPLEVGKRFYRFALEDE